MAAVGGRDGAATAISGRCTLAAVKDHDPQLVAHEVCRLRLSMLRSLKTWSALQGRMDRADCAYDCAGPWSEFSSN
jgi:hypothetical protein